jgi:ABC-type amino acid transport substrate-binding protein
MLIQIGADPFPPYQFETATGITGMDYELVKEAFTAAGMDIRVTLKVWPAIEKDYDEGEMRALFQVQPTAEREKGNLFSDELRKAVTEIITSQQEGQPISLEPFYTTYHLGVLEGYSYGDAIDAIPENRKHRYPTQESLLEAVAEGKEAYGVFDRGVRGYLQQHMGIDGVMPLPGMDFLRPLAVMFHKSDTTLRDAFNTGLRSIRDKGLYDKIMQSWKQG